MSKDIYSEEGFTVEEIEDIAKSTSGRVVPSIYRGTQYGHNLITRGSRGFRVTALTRLGTSRNPDPLGTVTSGRRPKNIAEALRGLSKRAEELRSR